jgi:glycine cleavage system H protein
MSFAVDSDLRYLRTGEWARTNGDITVCGLSQYAEIAQVDVVYVQLPSLGWEFKAGESFGVVESLIGVTDVYTPISGVVSAVNDALELEPSIINKDPYGEGWLIQLKHQNETEIELLMNADDYIAWVAEVEASREMWSKRRNHTPQDLIGAIIGKHRVLSILAMGAEVVVFNLQDVETREVDRVLKVPSSDFRLSWWSELE